MQTVREKNNTQLKPKSDLQRKPRMLSISIELPTKSRSLQWREKEKEKNKGKTHPSDQSGLLQMERAT